MGEQQELKRGQGPKSSVPHVVQLQCLETHTCGRHSSELPVVSFPNEVIITTGSIKKAKSAPPGKQMMNP